MENQQEINILHLLRFISKNATILVVFVVLGIITGVLAIYFVPRHYRAEGVLALGSYMKQDGHVVFNQDADKIADQINYSYTDQYPKIKADAISNGILRIYTTSPVREQAIKDVLEVEVLVLEKDKDYQKTRQNTIDKLKAISANLRLYGQGTENIELRIFDLQNEIDSMTATQVSGEPKVSQTGLNPVLDVIVGGLLGFLIGLIFVASVRWIRATRSL